MRFDDASQPVSDNHEPVARPDLDILPPGSFGPATGNAITGQGTNSGPAGADSVGASATITQVQGAGGQTVVSNGNFQVPGQYGVLQMDAQGNFNYVRNPNTPDGVKDVFNYTVADAAGNASTTLTIDIAQVAAAAAGQGVVALPAGVELSDIHINGRDLVINMPDGTQMVIPNGAVFVPEITIGDVQVPPTNIAALLIDTEPQPAAGPAPSSGGDWNDPVPPLDPGVPLGDLIPPTELNYTPPTFVEAGGAAHQPPTVVIETPDNPAPGVVDAHEEVFEKGLPERNGNLPNEPAGSGEAADGNPFNNSDPSETNTGTIVFTADAGVKSVTVDGVAITQVGQTIQGQYGTMTITGIDLAHGTITYSYTLADNTSGDNTADHFAVVVTDSVNQTAAATLTVNIVDDVPTARNDTDTVDANNTATGNVITGADTTSGAAGADTVGADNASLTSVSSNSTGQSDATFDASGNLVVHGEFGTLTIKADGSYVYTLDANTHGGANDVFTYTITDGDGDTSTATLTITVPALNVPPVASDSAVTVSEEALASGNHDAGGSDNDSGNDVTTASGTINPSDANGDTLTITLGIPSGNYTSGGQAVHWSVSADGHTLTGYTGSDPTANQVVIVTINNSGQYNVQLLGVFDDPNPGEDSINFVVAATVDDGHGGSTVSNITVTVEDDTPIARNDTDTLDPNLTATGNVITGAGTTSGSAGADSYGADGPGGLIGISSNFSHQSDTSFDQNGNLVVHGEFGTLTIKADGSYVYTLDANSHGGGNDVFTYTINDGDGDQTTATLTINVPAQNQPPTATDGSAIVSEEVLAGGNNDSGGSDSDSSNDVTSVTVHNTDAGGLHISDPDGDPMTVTLGIPSGTYTSHGQTVNWSVSPDGHTLTGYTGSDPTQNHVVVVTVDNTGTYTVQLLAQFDDPNGSGENSINFNVPVTVADNHGASTNVHINVTVEDDTPTIAASGDEPSLTVSETALNTPDSASFAGAFTVSFGADGPAASNSLVYALGVSSSGVDSGLVDTATGNHVYLFLQGGEVVGIEGSSPADAQANGQTVFTVSVDASTGEVTLDQVRAVVQPDGTNPDTGEGVSPLASAITLTATATDYDGDQASQQINIGDHLTLTDAGPTANPDTNSTAAGTTLIVTAVSASDVLHNDASGADGYASGGGVVGVAAGTDTSVAYSTGVGTVIHGTYGDLTLNADGSYTYVAKPNVSGVDHFVYTIADGDGDTSTTTLDITVNPVTAVVGSDSTIVSEEVLLGGTEHGGDTDSDAANDVLVNSGNISLTDSISGATFTTALTAPSGTYTSGGVTIVWTLSNNGQTLTGTAGQGGPTILVATIDNSGHYTVTLSGPIDTPNGVNSGENGGDSILTIGVTATDNFGNTLTNGTLTVHVEDDHPIASPDTNSTDAGTTLTVSAVSTSDVLHNDVSGADGYASGGGVVGVAAGTNTAVAYSTGVGTVIHGTYGDLTLNADGSYTYVAKPNVSGVDHFVYTIEDGDGDTSTTTLNITVNPVTAGVGSDSTIVSEEVLLGGTEHGGDTDSDAANDVLVNSGNISLTDSISGATFTTALTAPVGTYTSHGVTITWALSNGGHTLTGSAGATTVLVATIDNSGHYTVTLSAPIDTPNGVNSGENGGDSILTIGVTATDNFGNTLTSGSLTVHVEDDHPIASVNGNGVGTVTLDESAVGTDTPGGSPPVGTASATINLAAGFATAVYGADGPGSVSYALHLTGSNVNSGLYALDPTNKSDVNEGQGAQIVLNQSGNTITGSVGATVYFTITINPTTGVATFTQMNNIWNPVAGSTGAALDDTATLTTALASALQVVQTVTDYDGDTSSASINIGQGVFQIQDSGPTAIVPDSLTTTDAVQSKIFAYLDSDHNVANNFGTDGPGDITFTGITNGMDSGLKSGGVEITYWLSADGQTLDARINSTNGSDGTLIFEVHIDQATSQYDYTQFGLVDNGSGVAFDNLTSTKAGNVSAYGIGANVTGNPDVDALLTATSGGSQSTINTDATSIGVGNQSMNPGDSLRIDFVKALTTDSGNATLGFDYTQHVETNGFQQKIPQIVGNVTAVSFQVWALQTTDTQANLPDSNPAPGGANGFTNSTKEVITTVGIEGANPATQPMVTAALTTVGVPVLIAYGVTATLQADGSVIFSGVTVNMTYEIGTSGAANQFNAVDVQDVTGKFDLGIFALSSTNVGSPVNLSYGLQIEDADGDTVPLPGAINITLNPSGQQAAVVNNAVTTNSVTTNSTSTSGLIPGNDNGPHDHRAFNVGHSAAVMGALAAAGLEAEHSRFDWHALAQNGSSSSSAKVAHYEAVVASVIQGGASVVPTHIIQSASASNDASSVHHGGHHSSEAISHGHAGHSNGGLQPLVNELLHGSAPVVHGPVATAGPIIAPAVSMPSAQQLVAALGGHPQTSSATVGGAEHNQVVSQVLADALHGGESHGPSIETLVNSHGGHVTHDVIEALASHAGSAVPFSNSALAAAFHGSHNMFSMAMAHHDATPHHG